MKNLFLFVLLACSFTIIKAQDTLTMRSGENIAVKVLEVGPSEVKYKKIDNLNGPNFTVLKSNLLMIRYQNGSKDDFSSIVNEFTHGQNDAITYYQGYKPAATGTLLTTIIPISGPGFSYYMFVQPSSNPPRNENLGYPDNNLMNDQEYAKGYVQKAQQIKRKKVIKNFIVGIVLNLGLSMALLSPH